jgi:hypothetical protein
MSDRTSLLDDRWSRGGMLLEGRRGENSVSPELNDVKWDRESSLLANVASKGVSARGFGLLDQVNEYFKLKEGIETTIRAMDAERISRSIKEQLAPGQEVKLLVDDKTGDMTLLRPGDAYMFAEGQRPYEFRLTGNDDGVCRVNEVPDTTLFEVIGRDGEKEWLVIEDRYSRIERDRDDDHDDYDDGSERRGRYHATDGEM